MQDNPNPDEETIPPPALSCTVGLADRVRTVLETPSGKHGVASAMELFRAQREGRHAAYTHEVRRRAQPEGLEALPFAPGLDGAVCPCDPLRGVECNCGGAA